MTIAGPFPKTDSRFEKLTLELPLLFAFLESNARFVKVVCVCGNGRWNWFFSMRF